MEAKYKANGKEYCCYEEAEQHGDVEVSEYKLHPDNVKLVKKKSYSEYVELISQ